MKFGDPMLNNPRLNNSDWGRPNHCYYLGLSTISNSYTGRMRRLHYLVIQQMHSYPFEVVSYDGYTIGDETLWDARGVTQAIVLPNELGLIFPWYSLRFDHTLSKATRYEIR